MGLLQALLLLLPAALAAQEPGSIRGRVTDAATGAPLAGVTVALQGSELQTVTTPAGTYQLPAVSPGRYVVTFQLLGYAAQARPDVIVNPSRMTQADAELQVAAVRLEGIVVKPGYFPRQDVQPASAFVLNSEEVRRAPGSAGDVSRVLFSLPSTSQVADNANDLVVRGGAPFENGFFIDGIQVPNINHFPTVGSTGGPIGLVNVEFIDDVSFSAGAFPASFGDRLSSIVDIDFRDGSRERLETRLEMSMAGFGGAVEGPLSERSSFFLSARRSFLDFIVDAIGTGVAPRYGDLHGKLTWEPDAHNTVSVLALGGISSISFTRDDSEDNGNPSFGDNSGRQGTLGFSWRHVWGSRGYSLTSLSATAKSGEDDFWRTASGDSLVHADHLEAALRLRNVNRLRLGGRSSVELGAELEASRAEYDYVFARYTDRLGNEAPRLAVDRIFEDAHASAFATHSWALTPDWKLNTGLRADYYTGLDDIYLSPRASMSWQVSERLSLNTAGGLFRQRLPAFLLSQDPAFELLPPPRAVHAVAGLDYLLAESVKLTAEVYGKWYDDFPLEVEDPTLFVVDDGTSLTGPRTYRTLVADGRARAFGGEVMIQKRLAEQLYGLVSAAWSRSRYRDLDGTWRDRVFDNRYLFNIVAGYRPSHRWELSGRWALSGGAPYTPLDEVASAAANATIIDDTRLLGERYPAYHTLNLRADRRFVLRGSALTVSLSLWNAYNRENVALYYWNEVERKPDELLQWSFFPVLGLEWEF